MNTEDKSKVHTIISGCGFAGMVLALLLEQSGRSSYVILERAKEPRPLGSAISLSPTVLHLLYQLGFQKEIEKISKPYQKVEVLDENLKLLGAMDLSRFEERYGVPSRMMARYDLFFVLLKRIPKDKIQWGKRVMSIQQNHEGVLVRTSDNGTMHGDLLVGADGAYSGVRQSLFKDLSSKDLLPASDSLPMTIGSSSLVGVTNPLDPTKYKEFQDINASFKFVVGNKDRPHSWAMVDVPSLNGAGSGHSIAWMCSSFFAPQVGQENLLRNSGWGPEDAEAQCQLLRDCVSPFGYGDTLGFFMDNTPKENISKVLVEEKFFETWYHGRTVLIGDAAHKISPAAGMGAVQAILDAVSLANQLHELKSSSVSDITIAFEAYYKERRPLALAAVNGSAQFGKIFSNRGTVANIARKLFLSIPKSLQYVAIDAINKQRPQASFLPFVEDNGSQKRKKQEQSENMVMGGLKLSQGQQEVVGKMDHESQVRESPVTV